MTEPASTTKSKYNSTLTSRENVYKLTCLGTKMTAVSFLTKLSAELIVENTSIRMLGRSLVITRGGRSRLILLPTDELSYYKRV
jgi:hypothetical protein